MSGGSWDYVYQKVEEVSDHMRNQKEPIRRAFGLHLVKVAKALKAVEWVDSCDSSPGDERASIEAVLGINAKAAELEIVKEDVRKLIKELERLTP